jgi:predicted nucleotidyltransferase component of viral defense system
MIPHSYITEWRNTAPWQNDAQVEQDFIISEALVKLYQNEIIKKSLAFRGGTALNKLFFKSSIRYSEDIDLVQISSAPFGELFDEIRNVLDYLGKPQSKSSAHNNALVYKIESESGQIIKLKIEINTREHFAVLGYSNMEFIINASWLNAIASITTYCIEELLATKLRALYQRKKGRDLFDLWYALENIDVDITKMIMVWRKYMQFENNEVSKKDFLKNLEDKMNSTLFLNDMSVLITHSLKYDVSIAMELVIERIISKL